jgi:hypothetical protein
MTRACCLASYHPHFPNAARNVLSKTLVNTVLDEKETAAHMQVLRDALPDGGLDDVDRLEVEAPGGGHCKDADVVAQRVAAGQNDRHLLQHVLEQVDALVDVLLANLGPDELRRGWDRCTVCIDIRSDFILDNAARST